MILKLLAEYRLGFLSLKGGFRGSTRSTLVKMSNCWKSPAPALINVKNATVYVLDIITRESVEREFICT